MLSLPCFHYEIAANNKIMITLYSAKAGTLRSRLIITVLYLNAVIFMTGNLFTDLSNLLGTI